MAADQEIDGVGVAALSADDISRAERPYVGEVSGDVTTMASVAEETVQLVSAFRY